LQPLSTESLVLETGTDKLKRLERGSKKDRKNFKKVLEV
jgi:hypothetical protein